MLHATRVALAASCALFFATACAPHAAPPAPQRFNVIGFFTGKQDQAHISFLHEAVVWFPIGFNTVIGSTVTLSVLRERKQLTVKVPIVKATPPRRRG